MGDLRPDMTRRRLLWAATGIAATGVATPAVAQPDITYAPDPVFQGQRFFVFGDDITDGTTYRLRRVTRVSGGRVEESRFVEQVTADADTDVPPELGGHTGAAIEIDSGELEAGQYFVVGGNLPSRPETTATVEVVGVAGPPTATLELAPEMVTVHAGGTTTIELVVAGAEAGVGGYDLELNVEDPAIARITDIDHTGELSGQDDELLSDGAGARINANLRETPHDPGNITVAVVTLTGEASGEAAVSIADAPTIRGADRNRYSITDRGSTTATVLPVPTATVDVDPEVAEVAVGDEVAFEVAVRDPTTAVREYDFAVRTADSEIVRFVTVDGTDHEAAGFPTTSGESEAGAEGTLSAVFEEPYPERTISAGRVVVEAVEPGEMEVTVEGTVTAGDSAPYDLTSTSGLISIEPADSPDIEAEEESPPEASDTESATEPDPEPEPEPVNQPGFGFGGAAVGVGAAWYLRWRCDD